MKTSRIFALAAACCMALASTGQAQDNRVVGCWSAGTSPLATVCFGRNGNGLFQLIWDQGRCGGNAYINDISRGVVKWEVPRQASACVQEASIERLARREYTCRFNGRSLNCREVILLDDGKIWEDKPNVEFDQR